MFISVLVQMLKNSNLLNKINLISQKEYLIITPDNSYPVLATNSVRCCIAILIHHPKRSGMVHWDDNTCNLELKRFVTEFLGNDLTLEKCAIHLIGSWDDHPSSKKSGEFLKDYFSKYSVNLDFYQKKKYLGSSEAEQGYSLVCLDACDGKVYISDDWSVTLKQESINSGFDIEARMKNRVLLDLTHLQIEHDQSSGTSLIPRDSFFNIQAKEANTLCVAARDNKIELIKKAIDTGITNVNVAPKNTKGWAPLHFACKQGHYDVALLLIDHGADLFQKNDLGKTPLELLPNDPFKKRQLLVAHRLLQVNMTQDKESLICFSVFSRHPDHISKTVKDNIISQKKLLKTEEGLLALEYKLGLLKK